MKTSTIKMLSAMVASGRGQDCNLFIADLRTHLLTVDPKTGLSKVWLLKNGRQDHLKDFYRISSESVEIFSSHIKNIQHMLMLDQPPSRKNTH